MRLCISLFALLITAACQAAFEDIIPASKRVDWVTVGVPDSVSRTRTNLIDVTQAPYNADKTGATSASTAIQSAITAAQSNDVVYLPTGRYRIGTGLTLDKSYITLRGDGPTNTVLLGITASSYVIKVGHDPLQASQAGRFAVSAGVDKGSTNLTLISTNSDKGNFIRIGDMLSLSISTRDIGTDRFPIISVAHYDRIIKQVVCIASVNGSNVTLTAPLVWDMTNAPSLLELSPGWVAQPRRAVGIENLGITLTNGTEYGTAGFMVSGNSIRDCWFTGLDLAYANNYQLYLTAALNCEVSDCTIRNALSTGTSHSGLLVASSSGCLFENNIFANGLFPAIEFNDGTMGCAFAYNYFTNVTLDIDCHNTHPMMNLFEGNVMRNFKMDGYFGSASHQTLFRNRIMGVGCKRWTSYMQVVGNVLGETDASRVYSREEDSYAAPWPIFEFGFPNIGNSDYAGTSPPKPWNFPGHSLLPATAPFTPITNGIYVFPEDQGPTNVLWGNFTNIPAPIASIYPLIFQDGIDTNKYYGEPNGGALLSTAAGTASNLTLNTSVTVSNGWTLYIAGQNAYQQRQAADQLTHTIHGNLLYTNVGGTLAWDSNIEEHTLPASLLYASAPSWWGTNRWPAIDPEAAVPVAPIPAENRYWNVDNGTYIPPADPPGGGGTTNAPPRTLNVNTLRVGRMGN